MSVTRRPGQKWCVKYLFLTTWCVLCTVCVCVCLCAVKKACDALAPTVCAHFDHTTPVENSSCLVNMLFLISSQTARYTVHTWMRAAPGTELINFFTCTSFSICTPATDKPPAIKLV